jgi:hypothetical protein
VDDAVNLQVAIRYAKAHDCFAFAEGLEFVSEQLSGSAFADALGEIGDVPSDGGSFIG